MYTALLPPGVNSIEVHKYIIAQHVIFRCTEQKLPSSHNFYI